MGKMSLKGKQHSEKSYLVHIRTHPRFCFVVFVTDKNEEDSIELTALEWPDHIPHYNPMGAILFYGT